MTKTENLLLIDSIGGLLSRVSRGHAKITLNDSSSTFGIKYYLDVLRAERHNLIVPELLLINLRKTE